MTKHIIINSDVIAGLRSLPDACVQCVVTSPPYFGLRDYNTATWDGGDPECDHKKPSQGKPTWGEGSTGSSTLKGKPTNDNHVQQAHYKDVCGKCGAVRVDKQIGLEETPEAYVQKLVEVFREVRRVLRDDGVVWLNLGDSYGGGHSTGSQPKDSNGAETARQTKSVEKVCEYCGVSFVGYPYQRFCSDKCGGVDNTPRAIKYGYKPKDLIGIPWRVAFALQADGWFLRQDIIWSKNSCMPESVTDRCTKSHEYLFLLTKKPKYFFDHIAIQEPAAYDGRKDETFKGSVKSYDGVMPNGQPHTFAQSGHERWRKDENGSRVRNKRSVWTINPQPYPDSHFAVFPPALVEPCVKAGSAIDDTVMDIFGGSGTVAQVARDLNRSSISIELNPGYVKLIKKRLRIGEQLDTGVCEYEMRVVE